MTTAAPSASRSSTTDRTRLLGLAAAASIAHAVAMIPGYAAGDGFQVREFAVILAFSLAVSIAVFQLIVPNGGPVTSIVLGAVALVAVVAFWALLTLPLAAAAATVAQRHRDRPETRKRATVGLVLAGLATVLLLAAILTDGVTT